MFVFVLNLRAFFLLGHGFGFNFIRWYGQWLSKQQSTLLACLESIIIWTIFFSRLAVVVVFFLVAIFPFTTQSNEERMKAALSVNSECNINIANMKIRLKPTMMGEQRALTCQHVLLSFKRSNMKFEREIHSISVNRMFSK